MRKAKRFFEGDTRITHICRQCIDGKLPAADIERLRAEISLPQGQNLLCDYCPEATRCRALQGETVSE